MAKVDMEFELMGIEKLSEKSNELKLLLDKVDEVIEEIKNIEIKLEKKGL